MTAPGAPVTGLAVPVSTPPSPSLSHHTPSDQATDTARAALTAGRHSRPTAMASWVRADAVFQAGRSCAIRWSAHRAGLAKTAGLPVAVGSSTWLTKDLLYMYGWNCRAASSSQTSPSAICSPRRMPRDSWSAARVMMLSRIASARARRAGDRGGECAGLAAAWAVLLVMVTPGAVEEPGEAERRRAIAVLIVVWVRLWIRLAGG